MWGKYTYLILDLITLSPVLFLSFDPWVKFYKKWIPSLLAILIVGAVFVIWDIWFTKIGVWEFNPEYLVGIDIVNLPLEEWLFFLVVPWVCVFISEALNYHLKNWIHKINFIPVLYLLFAGSLVGLILGSGLYTRINFGLGLIVIALHLWIWDRKQLNLYAATYLVHLLPFIIVNGVLTGEPVVIYNNDENLGIRVGSIPIEDFIYSYNLIGGVFLFYYYFIKKLSAKST